MSVNLNEEVILTRGGMIKIPVLWARYTGMVTPQAQVHDGRNVIARVDLAEAWKKCRWVVRVYNMKGDVSDGLLSETYHSSLDKAYAKMVREANKVMIEKLKARSGAGVTLTRINQAST